MSGAYCIYCCRRCFVYRIVPDGPRKGWGGHMATCRDGMAFDLKVLGHTHVTAVNPITEPEAAEEICAWAAAAQGRKAAALAVEDGRLASFASQVAGMLPDPEHAPKLNQMTGSDWLAVVDALRYNRDSCRLVWSYWYKAEQATGAQA